METKITKKITGLLVLLFTFISFASFAQIEKTKQQKQDEQGAALKKWFDEGEIIIEGMPMEAKYVENSYPNSGDGYLCQKIKVNYVLKGSLNVGFINLKISDKFNGEGYPTLTSYLMKIKKTDLKNGAYEVENTGVYIIAGATKALYNINYMGHPFDNSVSTYQMLEKYCKVKVDLTAIKKEKDKRQVVLDSIEVADYLKHVPKLTDEQQKKYEEGKAKIMEHRKHLQEKSDSLKAINDLKKKINNPSVSNTTGCQEIFLSEQLDGNGSNNSVEVYNSTSSPINLSNYSLLIYHNASHTPTTIPLTGTISAYGTHVVAQQGASSAILARANQITNNLNFNGNVVTALNKGNVHIDIIGEIGVANAAGNWTLTPSGGTNNSDIRRKYNVGVGDTNWANSKSTWDVFNMDSVSNLGAHTNVCSVDPDLNVTFANGTVVGNNFEFDIMVSSTGADTYLNGFEVDFMYSINAFGTKIATNHNITATLGAEFNTPTYHSPSVVDEGIDSTYILFALDDTQPSWNRHKVTSTPDTLLHISIAIQNCNKYTNISFIWQAFAGSAANFVQNANDNYNTATTYPYTNVNYVGTLNTLIPPCSANPQITGFTGGLSPNSVAAGAADNNTGGTESLLTINGSGFGSLRPTVYMKNAVDNNNPQFIPLDPYDLKTWSNTQITLLVPSVMFPILPDTINYTYPGTGYIYVKPNGATDSAVSTSMVQVPYSLLNVKGGTSYKVRVPFAYRQLFSTTSFHIDTTAYDFRFDATTVTGNIQPNGGPNCRALLKQVIEDWACKIPIKYRIGRDTTINNPNPDGISYITFKPTLSNPGFGAETSVKVNGNCSTGHTYATEADVSFNSTVNWYYVSPSLVPNNTPNPNMQGSPLADFFTTALHELGHASLLLHVNQTNDLMYFHIPSTSGTGPYISSADSAGARNNLNWSKGVTIGSCPYSPFTIPASGATTCVDPETGTVSIEQFSANTQLSVYPNPAADFINVTFTKQTESSNTIKLVNVIGQTVFYSNMGKNEGAQEVINLQSISKGVYLLIVTDNENTITKKIIIE